MRTGPTNEELKTRLEKRFPGSPTVALASVQSLVQGIASKSWTTAQDAKDRKADLSSAILLLDSNSEAMVSYLRTAVDLQLTKASALRTYCALVVAIAFSVFQLANPGPAQSWLLVIAIALCLVAALVTISTSFTSWPTEQNFSTAESEATWLVGLLGSRGRRVNVAVSLTRTLPLRTS